VWSASTPRRCCAQWLGLLARRRGVGRGYEGYERPVQAGRSANGSSPSKCGSFEVESHRLVKIIVILNALPHQWAWISSSVSLVTFKITF
jgi:hypothetical protein